MARRKWNLSVAAALVCISANLASAAEPGFYLTAALGRGNEDPKSAGTNVGNSQGVVHVDPNQVTVDDGSTAWSVGLGYRINKYLSGELEYIDFGSTNVVEDYSVPNPFPSPFPTNFSLDYSSQVTGPALSLLGTLPVGGNFELFVRGGALFASRQVTLGNIGTLDEKFASTVWLAGAGVSWSFAKHFGIRAEYQQAGALDKTIVSGETKVKRLSLGAVFRF